jgi:hypothetical protein
MLGDAPVVIIIRHAACSQAEATKHTTASLADPFFTLKSIQFLWVTGIGSFANLLTFEVGISNSVPQPKNPAGRTVFRRHTHQPRHLV